MARLQSEFCTKDFFFRATNFPYEKCSAPPKFLSLCSVGQKKSGKFPPNFPPLVAPYCAIPRDYLSDTPLLRAMGFLVSQHGQLGAIPPPPFLSVSTVESMRSGGAIPDPEKGYLSDTSAKANGCDTPLCDTISKGYCAIWGGISHWAAKFPTKFSKFPCEK